MKSEDKEVLGLAWDCVKYGTVVIAVLFLLGVVGNTLGIINLRIFGVAAQDAQREVFTHKQEQMMNEKQAQVGLPNIKNFREAKFANMIMELRDQEGVVTYAFVFAQGIGKFIYVGQTIGYPLPYATQTTSPQKPAMQQYSLPQAEPNGLFSPESAEGTWVLMLNADTGNVEPQYFEERLVVLSFKPKGPNFIY